MKRILSLLLTLVCLSTLVGQTTRNPVVVIQKAPVMANTGVWSWSGSNARFTLPNFSSPPTGSLTNGQMYYHSTDHKFYAYVNSTWVEIPSGPLVYPISLSNGGTGTALGNGSSGQVMSSSGLGSVTWSTSTYPSLVSANNLLYASGANVIGGLATANNGALVTSGAGVPSINTTLPFAVQTNITGLGTVTSGTWSATAIGVTKGGTAQTSWTQYAIPYLNTTTSFSEIGIGTANYLLAVNGTTNGYSWKDPADFEPVLSKSNLTATTPVNVSNTPQIIGASASAITIDDAVADGATKGAAAFATSDFETAAGVVSIDYTNGQAAATGVKGFLTGTDWDTFNGKEPAVSKSNLTGTTPVNVSNTPQIIGGSASAITIDNAAADAATKGAASFETNDFNSTTGNISLDYANGQEASAVQDGFLSSADWTTFNGKSGYDPANTFTVGATGCDYTTIQSAIDACTGGETIEVYPGVYTETITFDIDSVAIVGAGRPHNIILTQADANVVNFATQTHNSITGIAIRLTAPTDATKDAITISTGTASIRECNLYLATASAIAGVDQPHIVNVTGAGTLNIQRGQVTYKHTGATTNGYKTAFYCGEGGSLNLYKIKNIDIDNSGTATATSIFAHTTTGTILMYRCMADIDDNDATFTVGFGYVLGTATTLEFSYNDIHVHAHDNNAYGVYITDPTIRLMYNHIHVEEDGAGAAFGIVETGTGSVISQFDDVVATGASSGNIVYVHSLADGDFDASGRIGAATYTDDGSVTNAEFKYINTVSSNVQDQINTKSDIHWDEGLTVNETYEGKTVTITVGENVVFGEVIVKKSDNEYYLTDADATTTMPGQLMALETKGDGQTCLCLITGYIVDTDWNWTLGDGQANTLYCDDTTPGAMVQHANAPSDVGDQVQVVGRVITADCIYFHPDYDLTEVGS